MLKNSFLSKLNNIVAWAIHVISFEILLFFDSLILAFKNYIIELLEVNFHLLNWNSLIWNLEFHLFNINFVHFRFSSGKVTLHCSSFLFSSTCDALILFKDDSLEGYNSISTVHSVDLICIIICFANKCVSDSCFQRYSIVLIFKLDEINKKLSFWTWTFEIFVFLLLIQDIESIEVSSSNLVLL